MPFGLHTQHFQSVRNYVEPISHIGTWPLGKHTSGWRELGGWVSRFHWFTIPAPICRPCSASQTSTAHFYLSSSPHLLASDLEASWPITRRSIVWWEQRAALPCSTVVAVKAQRTHASFRNGYQFFGIWSSIFTGWSPFRSVYYCYGSESMVRGP
jgi:hypothetical protein